MILVGNGPLITRDKNHPFYQNGAVVIEGTKIIEVGEFNKLRLTYPSAEFMDANGMVIMPGLINAHEHIYSAFARGLNLPGPAPKDFLETLSNLWWKIDRNLEREQVYQSAIATYMECIKNGVTTVVDHHASYGEIPGSLITIAKAAEKLKIRTCLAYEISDRDGDKKMREAVKENMDFLSYTKEKDSDMLKGLIGLHASFTLSDETLRFIKNENTLGAGYHVHVAEGSFDQRFTEHTYHKSVVRRLYEFGILNQHTIAGHCIHISESDMELLKETNTMVVHNPESNMNNGVGCPDVITMLDKGITVGLGTDGYTNDMLESLKVANILQKHRRGMPDRGFMEACTMLFDNNSCIASKLFEEEIGILKKNAKADLILVDYHPYTPLNETNIDGHMMFGLNGSLSDTTIINGEVVMRNKKLLVINEEEALQETREATKSLWRKLEK